MADRIAEEKTVWKPAGSLKEALQFQKYQWIGLEDITDWPFNPRRNFDPAYLAKLAQLIEEQQQMVPAIVRPHPTVEGKFQGVCGECRAKAIRQMGKSLILARVAPLSERDAYLLALRDNMEEQGHGKPLDPLEEAAHIKLLMDKFGWTQTQVAQELHCTQPWISAKLKLIEDASPELQGAIISRLIDTTSATEIARLPKEDQPAVVEKAIEGKLSKSDIRDVVKAVKEAPSEEQKRRILEGSLEEAPKAEAPPTVTKAPPKPQPIEFEGIEEPEALAEEMGKIVECPRCHGKLAVNWEARTIDAA